MSNPISEFNDYRSRMNKQLLEGGSNTLKRIFSLDKQAFQEGSLDVATKELLGLVASTVLGVMIVLNIILKNVIRRNLAERRLWKHLKLLP